MRNIQWSVLLTIVALVGGSSSAAAQEANRSGYIGQPHRERDTVVVFVHGIFGDGQGTWENQVTKQSWPRLLSTDEALAAANIYVFEYDSPLLGKTYSLSDLADQLETRVAPVLENHSRVVFVAHSMGGLITRAFLLKYRSRATKVSMLYLLGTPSGGSFIARIADLLSRNPQLGRMMPMAHDSYLADQAQAWRASGLAIPTYCAYELRSTYGIKIVEELSATHLCDRPGLAIDSNHIDIAKPRSRSDLQYVAFLNAYRESRPRPTFGEPVAAMRNEHPVVDLSHPLDQQIQLFAQDKVKIYADSSVIQAVRFGGVWMAFDPEREYLVIGVPGVPVRPEFRSIRRGHIKLEITFSRHIDQPRDLRRSFTPGGQIIQN